MPPETRKSLRGNTGTDGNRLGTDSLAHGSRRDFPRRGNPPAGPDSGTAVETYFRRRDEQKGRKAPPTLPLDYDVISRHVPFRAARSVGIELWLKWRHGECERAVFTADTHVATGYKVDGEWYITLVKPR